MKHVIYLSLKLWLHKREQNIRFLWSNEETVTFPINT